MSYSSVHHIYLFILLTLIIGQGDGRWKKSNREMLQHDIQLFKDMTARIKEELGEYYDESSDEAFTDYFFEEIDYLQSKIEKTTKKKMKIKGNKDINSSNNQQVTNYLSNSNDKGQFQSKMLTKGTLQDVIVADKNVTFELADNKFEWPSFEDILTAMGKKYDWKNDRWIKVKNRIKDKDKTKPFYPKSIVEHQKHNFRYRIVKLNRAKSKRNIVVAVTAVR